MSMNMIRKLPTPQEIKELYPLSDKIVETKKQRDKEIADVFTGKSNKFLLIIGPCSADKEDSSICAKSFVFNEHTFFIMRSAEFNGIPQDSASIRNSFL